MARIVALIPIVGSIALIFSATPFTVPQKDPTRQRRSVGELRSPRPAFSGKGLVVRSLCQCLQDLEPSRRPIPARDPEGLRLGVPSTVWSGPRTLSQRWIADGASSR